VGVTAAPALLAGFGLFFIGIRLIGDNLQQLATRPVRKRLGKVMGRRGVASLTGFGLGALVQSTSGVTFIIMSLLTSGVVQMKSAMTMLGWSNVGTAILVMLSAIDLKLIALYILAICGFSFFQGYDKQARFRHYIYAAFGLSLLFLGLSMIKDGIAMGRGNYWVETFILFASDSSAIAFLVGLAAAMITQSSATVTIASLPLVSAGLLPESQTALVVYGASVGSGLGVMMLTSNLDGIARQLGLLQALLKILAAVVFMLLYVAEEYGHIPLVQAGVNAIMSDIGGRVAMIYLTFQLGAALIGQVLQNPLRRVLAAISPSTEREKMARPLFLFDDAIADPDTALSLVDLEQARLIQMLPAFLDSVRAPDERPLGARPIKILYDDSANVALEVDLFLSEMAAANPAFDGLDQMFEARERLHILQALQVCTQDFVVQIGELPEIQGNTLGVSMVEALHLLLDILADLSKGDAGDDMSMLSQLTQSRSGVMESIRKKMFNEAAPAAEREAFIMANIHFERVIWQVGCLLPTMGKILDQSYSEAA
jgi:phosphate:Na+ symporter